MAHHRTDAGRRGVSRGLVFAALCVILIVAVGVLWWQLGDRVDRQGNQAAGTCVEGKAMVSIIADPDITDALRGIAKSYNQTHPVVRDHCITIDIRPGDSRITYQGLTESQWDSSTLGAFPAAWVPQSSVWTSQLQVTKPALLDGTPESLVTSPIVLAVSPEFKEKVDGKIDWGQLPTLARTAGSLSRFGLTGWGALRLAMPTGPNSDPTALSAQAVATEVTRSQSLLTASDADSTRVRSSIQVLLDEAPKLDENTSAWAADTIANAADPAKATIHAVPITEAQLYILSRAGKSANLRELTLGGTSPLADFPVTHLSGDKVSTAQADGVGEFFAFVRQAEQMKKLTALGFRGDAALPQANSTVSFPVIPNPMPVPEPGAVVAVNKALYGKSG
ncbi:hypothetical protein GOEFS_105_00480 [Gordonia effusa NBRC 100432]|uniref:Uncharacterized protein n=1 Tax=Gordonia effusa NBRC 100432 TaxID=1077974 RepID=H0R4N6_9ACTN|nr:substrate-binding domain-containing protein [Gordonia effusa]GAB20037.1 hypothetical protein GOEFS_105_00480 [Gordonia effusa NBRC 100432]